VKLGSLCSGYGGLDLAIESIFNVELAWYSEYDKNPSKIMEKNYPGITNHKDLTKIKWEQIEQVDILSAGYPCQPFSQAGQRKGTDDPRHLWPYIANAIRILRPGLVVLENVRGHLSLGFNHVLQDLATIGYAAQWQIVQASDIGAPHQRSRLFVIAYLESARWWTQQDSREPSNSQAADGLGAVAEPNPSITTNSNYKQPVRDLQESWGGSIARTDLCMSESRAETTPNTTSARSSRSSNQTSKTQTQSKGLSFESLVSSTPNTNSQAHEQPQRADRAIPSQGSEIINGSDRQIDWGRYQDAITNWERLTRLSPEPITDGRLEPRFVEWMMGLPAGWVTDTEITENSKLKALGNGVVPQQAAYALTQLLAR